MNQVERKTIHEAMVRLADGDRSAVRALLDQLWPVLVLFVRRGVGHEQDAEDVAQEAFLRICSRIADFDQTRDGLSWAFGIAKYEVMTQRQRRRRHREAAAAAELALLQDPNPTQEAALLDRDLLRALEHALGTLTPEDRQLFASSAQAHSATVRKRRQRALERLRSIWRRLYGEL
ncbi:MAG TPA: RNA polymerase sigma factor [Polyangiaceae bacterium]|nr:RNA polymerase sigma factor [Polyangiaceae bacterium]